MFSDILEERDAQIQQITEKAYNLLYACIWDDNDLNQTESQLAWLRVLSMMVSSAVLEAQHAVHRKYFLAQQTQPPQPAPYQLPPIQVDGHAEPE